MFESEILLKGITLDHLNSTLLDGMEERIKELVERPEKKEVKYLTRKEVAELLSISLPTLHDWCKRKILNPYRVGNRVYFKIDEIDQSLKQINV
ncbi:MAG: helix-turn-helix domain-containing protein [Cyclobacteriaceae bacterium]